MARSGLRSLPRNLTDVTRVLLRLDGAVRNDAVSAEVASLPTEDAWPIRQFFAWPGKRNYEGVWWSSTNRGHVEFESLLEREYLLAADAAVDVVAIAAQPLALLWPHGTAGQRNHVPDFFVRLASGDGRLVAPRQCHRQGHDGRGDTRQATASCTNVCEVRRLRTSLVLELRTPAERQLF